MFKQKTLIMKILLYTILFGILGSLHAQEESMMKMNAGIITEKIKESKAFYSDVLDFGVSFENDFYLLMHTPNESAEISFLLPNHPSQISHFQKAFTGIGTYLTLEVEDVDAYYNRIKSKNIPIILDLRDEVWGDRHFVIVDPNGIGIDIVTYTKPED